jgi:tRNA(fMet)-specific endonuclease VapC
MGYLLDTNIITAFLKGDVRVSKRLRRLEFQEIFISAISYYEIKRGLLAIRATRQLIEFDRFLTKVTVLSLDSLEIFDRASEIYAELRVQGRPIQDADILIAATAIDRGLTVVSNDLDLLRVRGLTIENWLEEKGEI